MRDAHDCFNNDHRATRELSAMGTRCLHPAAEAYGLLRFLVARSQSQRAI